MSIGLNSLAEPKIAKHGAEGIEDGFLLKQIDHIVGEAVFFDARGKTKRVSFSDCDLFYENVRQRIKPRPIGHPEFGVTVHFGLLTSPNFTLDQKCNDFEGSDSDGCLEFVNEETTLLSLVGPLLTLKTRYSALQGCGVPVSGASWKTIDLRTGIEADVTEFLVQASLLQALKDDSYLIGLMDKDVLATAENVWQILDRDRNRAFAFYQYDAKKNLVSVRIAMGEGSPQQVIEIGLWVTPRPDFVKYLASSETKEHRLFMSSAAKVRSLF